MRTKIITSVILILLLTVVGTTVLANQNEDTEKRRLQIIFNERYVFDEQLNEGHRVIIEVDGKDIHDIDFNKDEVIEIDQDTVRIPYGKVIEKWAAIEHDNQYVISPILIDKKDLTIDFTLTNGGKLSGEGDLPKITRTVEKETNLNEIIPAVIEDDGFVFGGWYTIEDTETEVEIPNEERQDLKDLNKRLKKEQDKLAEETDDKKAKEIEKKIKSIQKNIKEKSEEKQFDVEIIQEYQIVENLNEVILNENKEYIAIFYPDVNGNKKDDRTEKIKITIDFGLDNEIVEKTIHVGQPIKLSEPYHDDYIFVDWYVDDEYTIKYDNDIIFTKDTELYALWQTPETIIMDSSNELIYDEKISWRIEDYIYEANENALSKKREQSKENHEKLKEKQEDELFQHTEKKFTLKNYNLNQFHLMKFYNEEQFLFSLALPYGQTIELLNSNGLKLKEYAVRQESSIDLTGLINNSKGSDFDVKTIKKNNAIITQIYPKNNNIKEME